ncbi:MAG: hypothetical protein QHH26_01435 [Armatimonadota bacterium]|nr:hypothetical protein [Armatimonadota bacterium]
MKLPPCLLRLTARLVGEHPKVDFINHLLCAAYLRWRPRQKLASKDNQPQSVVYLKLRVFVRSAPRPRLPGTSENVDACSRLAELGIRLDFIHNLLCPFLDCAAAHHVVKVNKRVWVALRENKPDAVESVLRLGEG